MAHEAGGGFHESAHESAQGGPKTSAAACADGAAGALPTAAEADDSFTKEQMLAGEGAAQFTTLTQPPPSRQGAGSGAAAAATSSGTVSTISLPAPQPLLQRSATLPISYGPKPGSKDKGKGVEF